jgi:hypothetical protein
VISDRYSSRSRVFDIQLLSGSIAATETNDSGVTSVAPKTWLYRIKFLDSKGSGTTLDGIEIKRA